MIRSAILSSQFCSGSLLVVSVLRCTASFVFSENSGVQIGGGNARLVLADPEDNVHNSMVSRVSDLSLLFRK